MVGADSQADQIQVIAEIIAVELNASVASVLKATSLRTDLKMDSVSAANILYALEEVFDVSFDEISIRDVRTINDLNAIVLRARAEGPER